MATIENFVVKVRTEGTSTIKNLSNDVAALGNQFTGLDNTLGGVTANLGIVGSAAVAAVGAFTALGLRAINMADSFSDLSDATGISAGQLMNLKNSMTAAGGNTESYAKAVTKLSVSIGEAMGGNEKYQKSFQQLGVYVTDAKGKIRDSGDIVQDVVKKLGDIEDPAVRSALAVQLLGREAAKIDWSKVSAGRDAITDDQIKQLAKYREEMDKLVAQFEKGLINYFGELATVINQSGIESGLAKITEQVGSLVGKLLNLPTDAIAAAWNALMPDSMKISKAVGLGDPIIAAAKAAEDARYAATVGGGRGRLGGPTAKELADYEASKKPPAKGGTYGATPDATLKAIAESQKRIAQDVADAQKEIELKGASDIERINIEMRGNIAKAQAEITSRERLSEAQKAKETLAMVSKFTEKAANDTAKVREDQERSINQLKQQYAQSNLTLLGQEYTEVQKVTDMIAQQPAKYKEIGDQMLKNASLQDAEKKKIEEIIRLRQVDKELFALRNQSYAGAEAAINRNVIAQAQALGQSKEQLAILQAEFDAQQQLLDLQHNIAGAYEASMVAQGKSDELTQDQIKLAKQYNSLLDQRKLNIANELTSKIFMAEQDAKLAKDFETGWIGAYNTYVENSKRAADQARTYFETFSKGIEDVFYNMAKAGDFSFKSLKAGFKSVANSMIADFMRIQAQKALVGLFGGSGGGGFLGSLFGGFFADGGSPPMNKVSVVGERGPELFIPKQAGTIIPNDMLGGGQTVNTAVTYNIQAVDASSFRSLIARDPEFIHNVAEQGRRQLPIRSRR